MSIWRLMGPSTTCWQIPIPTLAIVAERRIAPSDLAHTCECSVHLLERSPIHRLTPGHLPHRSIALTEPTSTPPQSTIIYYNSGYCRGYHSAACPLFLHR